MHMVLLKQRVLYFCIKRPLFLVSLISNSLSVGIWLKQSINNCSYSLLCRLLTLRSVFLWVFRGFFMQCLGLYACDFRCRHVTTCPSGHRSTPLSVSVWNKQLSGSHLLQSKVNFNLRCLCSTDIYINIWHFLVNDFSMSMDMFV